MLSGFPRVVFRQLVEASADDCVYTEWSYTSRWKFLYVIPITRVKILEKGDSDCALKRQRRPALKATRDGR